MPGAYGTLTAMDATLDDRRWLAEVEEVAAAIVARAGESLLGFYRRGVAVEYKDKRQTDPVTVADRSVERQVRDEIRAAFPAHGFLGEEGATEATTSEYLWVLDPLDGTANFAGRLPFFGVSLALLRNGVPVVGCLWVPLAPNLRADVLRASYGNGARVGDEPLRVATPPFRPSGPVAVPPSLRWAFVVRKALSERPGEARNLGSITYELAMVAGGGFQWAVFAGPKLWDVAAGVLLIREAGGLALTRSRGRWVSLDRFVAPAPGKNGRPRTLRDWSRQVLVGSPATIGHVAPNLVPRRTPPRAVRWLLRRPRAVRRWWTARRKPAQPPTADSPPSTTPAPSGNGPGTPAPGPAPAVPPA